MSNKHVTDHLLRYLELCPGYVIIFPSLSLNRLYLYIFLIVASMTVKWMSAGPFKCQLPLVWHPSVNALRTNICSQKLLSGLCWFFQCLPGFSSLSPVIPAGPQKSKDPYLCDIAAASAGLLKVITGGAMQPYSQERETFQLWSSSHMLGIHNPGYFYILIWIPQKSKFM